MITTPVPDAEDIVRYVPPRLVNEDGTVDGAAFLPRPADHDGASVHRIDIGGPDRRHNISIIKAGFRLRRSPNGRFAQINVGAIKSCAADLQQAGLINVVADPLAAADPYPVDPAHALVRGLPTRGIMDELIVLHINAQIGLVHPAC